MSEQQMNELIEQVRQLTTRQLQLEQELQQARAAQQPPAGPAPAGAGPAGVAYGPPGGAAYGPPGIGIDTRLLGKPSDFSGAESEWPN